MNQSLESINALTSYLDVTEQGESALIMALQKAQSIFGYIPQEAQRLIAQKLDIPVATVYGVVSFYSFFQTEPKGKNDIRVCTGTACFVRKADKLLQYLEDQLGIKAGETRKDLEYSLGTVRCVGACGLAPVVEINGEIHGNLTNAEIDRLLKNKR